MINNGKARKVVMASLETVQILNPGSGGLQPHSAYIPVAAQKTVQCTLSTGGGCSASSPEHAELKLWNDNWLAGTQPKQWLDTPYGGVTTKVNPPPCRQVLSIMQTLQKKHVCSLVHTGIRVVRKTVRRSNRSHWKNRWELLKWEHHSLKNKSPEILILPLPAGMTTGEGWHTVVWTLRHESKHDYRWIVETFLHQ